METIGKIFVFVVCVTILLADFAFNVYGPNLTDGQSGAGIIIGVLSAVGAVLSGLMLLGVDVDVD